MSRRTLNALAKTHGLTPFLPGTRRSFRLEIGESYSGLSLRLPIMVWRAEKPGPTVLISSAVHGDEINGTGTIRALVNEPDFVLERGALVLIPVVNIFGFERHSRYTPDRRDLNRMFPGSPKGSLSARLAYFVTEEILSCCDYGIDLHTAAVRRTNFPNVRADMDVPDCKRLAEAFGCEIIINSRGPEGSLRNAATERECPTIILEAGEVWKVEPSYLATALRGIRNCLMELGMISGNPETPDHTLVVDRTRWIRADAGGFLQYHVAPGDLVEAGQILATNTGLLGAEQEQIVSPLSGAVIGMSTMPAVTPGDPIIHIAFSGRRALLKHERQVEAQRDESIEGMVRDDLATSISVIDVEEPS